MQYILPLSTFDSSRFRLEVDTMLAGAFLPELLYSFTPLCNIEDMSGVFLPELLYSFTPLCNIEDRSVRGVPAIIDVLLYTTLQYIG